MKLSVAIPLSNEAETLPPLIVELRSVLETLDCDYEVLFVNDGRDATALDFSTGDEEARSRPLYALSGSMNSDADATAVARAIVLGQRKCEAGLGPGHGR